MILSNIVWARYVLQWQIIIDTKENKLLVLPEWTNLSIEEYYNQLISEETVQETENNETEQTEEEQTTEEISSDNVDNVTDTEQEEITNNPTTQPTTNTLANAVTWMYANGMTKFDTVAWYNATGTLTREQSAKILVQANEALWYTKKITDTTCTFSDIEESDPSLSDFIISSCELWIFNWANGLFLPKENLTLWQLTALVMRIQKWGKLDETREPRYANYVDEAKALWIIASTTYTEYENPALRQDIALLLFALQWLEKREEVVWNIDIWWGVVTEWLSLEQDPVLQSAVFRMRKYNMTRFANITEYRPFETLSKQAAAKIMGSFHKEFVGWTPTNTNCVFDDSDQADQTLLGDIQYVCEHGILKWWSNIFNPNKTLTKAEFIIGLLRIIKEEEWIVQTGTPRRQWYFDKAVALGIVSQNEYSSFDSPITRYEVANTLYRFYVKNLLLTQIQQWQTPELLTYVSNDTVMIDISRLLDNDFEKWRLTLDGSLYQLIKTSNNIMFGQNSVWYGQVYDLATKKVTWVANFVISQGRVIQWTIRTSFSSEVYFSLTPQSGESGLYNIIIQ